MKKEFETKTWPKRRECFILRLSFAITVWAISHLSVLGSNQFPFVVDVTVDKPMQYLPSNGPAYIHINATASALPSISTSGSYTYAWVQLQDKLNPRAVNASGNGKAGIGSATSAASLVALPTAGVYEFQVTVTDAKNPSSSAIQRTWVNIWDSKPAFGSNPLMVAPGCAAPTLVRQLNSDPGPYQHPRVLCTQADWAAMNARVTGGSAVASQAFINVVNKTIPTLLGPTTSNVTESPITIDLLSYMGLSSTSDLDKPYTGNYSGNPQNLVRDLTSPSWDTYYQLLWNAGYLAWVNPSGAGITLQAVANLSAALAHFHLLQCYTASSGTFNTSSPDYIKGLDQIGSACQSDGGNDCSSLAIAYDFAYCVMSDSQREDVRKLLFAVGYNRAGAGAIPTRGFGQNGNFSNLGEYRVFLSLSIAGEEESVRALDPLIYNQFSKPVDSEPWTTAPSGPLPLDPTAWPYSTQATIGDLQREIWWSMDYNSSAWGWTTEREAYNGLTAIYLYPVSLALAIHGGENQFITNNIFDTKESLLWELYGGDKETTAPAIGLPGKLTSAFSTLQYLYDHHDSNNLDYRQAHVIFLKYMFPNDLAIDYIYHQNLPSAFAQGNPSSLQSPLWFAMFGLDPMGLTSGTPTTLAQAAAKEEQGAPIGSFQNNGQLIKVDPQMGATVVRSGWNENDSELYFDTSWQGSAHWHSEQNSFSFFALGRAWAFSPGRHDTISDAQSAVLYQDPKYLRDTATAGYRGESISSATQNVTGLAAFPPSPGKLVNVTEDPNHLFATITGDATFGYTWSNAPPGSNSVTGVARSNFMPDGFYGYFRAIFDGVNPVTRSQDAGFQNKFNDDINSGGSFVRIRPTFLQAKRSIIFVRKPFPYALIIDDFDADGANHNYRWVMSSAQGFAAGQNKQCIDANGNQAAASVTLLPGTATSSQAVFYHPVDLATGPRLLIKDCTESISGMTVPTITLEAKNNISEVNALNKLPSIPASTSYLTTGGLGGADRQPYVNSNRVIIDHGNVVKPQFKTLLFPFMQTGSASISSATPTTSTVVNGNLTTITISNPPTTTGTAGPIDTITLNAANLTTNPAQYISFSRATATAKAPTITLPANANLSVASGAAVNYGGITATSSSGANLTVTYSVASGTVLTPGVTTVTASAIDPSTGLETSQTFTVTVAPAAPTIAIQTIYNLDQTTSDNGISLSWAPVAGATSYNVYRATSANGTYSLVSSHLAQAVPNSSSISDLTIFNDRNLAGTSYFYRVTGVVTDTTGADHEGSPSNIIALAQSVPTALGLTAGAVGHVVNPTSGCGFAALTTSPLSFLLSQSNIITSSVNGKAYSFEYPYDEGYNFLSKAWSGDGTFTVRVTSEYENFGTATNPNAAVSPFYGSSYGLIFRDNAPTSNPGQVAEAGVYYSANPGHSNSVYAYSRPLIPYGDGVSASNSLTGQSTTIATPIWIRLARVGTTFTNSYSLDGQTWTFGKPSTIEMSPMTQVGVNMASGGSTFQDNGTFDNLVFLSPPAIKVANASLALDWSQSTGAVSYSLARGSSLTGPFTPVSGATATTATHFTDLGLTNLGSYYYQLSAVNASGVVTTVAPVLGTPAPYGTPLVTTTPGDGSITLNWNAISGATGYKIYQGSSPTSVAYTTYSTTGTSYTVTSLSDGSPYYFFVVASGPNGSGADSAVVGAVPVKWTDQDVGAVGKQGTFSASKGVLTVSGSGKDVTANTSDAFNYLYRTWTGDGTFITHIASITTTDSSSSASAKVGVMFRAAPASLSSNNNQNVFVLDSLTGTSLQSRLTASGGTNTNGSTSAVAPNWLRLERTGNIFTAFTSEDQVNWVAMGPAATASNALVDTIANPGLIGLAVNARNNDALCTANFDATAFLVTPQSLTTSGVQGSHLTLGWKINPYTNVTDATALQVEVSPSGANTWTVLASNISPLLNSYAVMGLNASTVYDFRVKELSNNIAGDYALLSGVKTTVEDLPTPPINLTGIVQSGTSVKLAWTNQANNADNYVVAFRTNGTTSWTKYASSLSPTTTSEIVQGLVEGKSYDFEVYATNLGGASLSPPMVTVILPAAGSFGLWAASYGLSGINATPSATPAGDGVSNSLKYLIGVNPTVPITAANRRYLPTLGTATQNGKNYLTLTYRQSIADATGISAVLQTSTDLMIWTITSPPDYSKVVATDPATNDPIIQVGVKIAGSRQFIRLELVTP